MIAMARDIPTLLAERARSLASVTDAPALTYYQGRTRVSGLSHAQLHAAVERVAVYLRKRYGVRRGERFGILAANALEVPVVVLALLRLGATAVPLNPNAPADDQSFILSHAAARGLFAASSLANSALSTGMDFICDLAPILRDAEQVTPTELASYDGDALAADMAVLLYTSGTTGKPKGVALSQAAVIANGRAMAERCGLRGEAQLAVLPLHHAHAFGFGLMTSLVSGGHLVFTAQFDPTAWEAIARAEAVSMASVVPVLLRPLREARVRKDRLPRLRALLVSSAPLPRDTAQSFEADTGVALIHGWGLSEYTNFACCVAPLEGEAERRHALYGHDVPSVGHALEGTQVSVIDALGRSLQAGQTGELTIRGPCTMQGYLNDPPATSAALKDGWLHSGDEGYFQLDSNGRPQFFVTGRIKEIIIRGGDKYSPVAIEARLIAVAPELEGRVVVVGFPHAVYGEEVGIYVEDDSTGALAAVALMAARAMPESLRPKVIAYSGSPIPRTHTGKVQRRILQPIFLPYQHVRGTDPCLSQVP